MNKGVINIVLSIFLINSGCHLINLSDNPRNEIEQDDSQTSFKELPLGSYDLISGVLPLEWVPMPNADNKYNNNGDIVNRPFNDSIFNEFQRVSNSYAHLELDELPKIDSVQVFDIRNTENHRCLFSDSLKNKSFKFRSANIGKYNIYYYFQKNLEKNMCFIKNGMTIMEAGYLVLVDPFTHIGRFLPIYLSAVSPSFLSVKSRYFYVNSEAEIFVNQYCIFEDEINLEWQLAIMVKENGKIEINKLYERDC
jgi:hypothetical protein